MLTFLIMMRTFMPKHILVTGSKGQLGCELHALVEKNNDENCTFYFTHRESLDIGNKEKIDTFCQKNNITTIINCAAYTAVDKAEEDVDNANAINHLAVQYMAEVAKIQNIQLIHISTDYVFDGTSFTPYVEEDSVNPQGVYGKTKLDGENAMIAISPKESMIIRTSWVYSTFGNNFVKTMLRLGNERDELGVIFDQVGTPTYAKNLAETILDIIQSQKLYQTKSVEIYHYSNEGVCSWYDFAKTIFALDNVECKVNPITSEQYPTPAKRPHYSILNKAKIKSDFGIDIPYWKDALAACLATLK
jgi:dTDP-4-dehydrorhamnose reductase